MHRLLFRVNVGVYNKHRRLRSGVHSVGRQKLSDAIRLDVSKHFIPFDGNNPHDVDSYHGKTRATMWILTTKGYGMMLPSRLHWAEGCGECAPVTSCKKRRVHPSQEEWTQWTENGAQRKKQERHALEGCPLFMVPISWGSLRGPLAGRIGQLPWLHWP